MMLREPRDEGVSPVVGMILVLGISVVGIAAILYWGLPAIDEMKANVEHKSLESQFVELDGSIKELVAGTTEKTAKRWLPTLNRGQLAIANETEGWVYATEMYSSDQDYDFEWFGFADGNHRITLRNAGTSAVGVTVQAYRINTTTSGMALKVNTVDASGDMVNTSIAGNGGALTLYVYDGAAPARMDNATIRFRVFTGAHKLAEAFYVPTGRVDYRLDAGLGTKTVSENNGAVITGNGNTYAITNSPPIPPVATASGVPRFFGRAVLLNGTGSFAGEDRFDVLVSLYSTSTLASYDCAETSRSDCVETTKLFLYGRYNTTWQSYLTNAGRGYGFALETKPSGVEGAIDYLVQRPSTGYMGYTLLQSRIQLTGSG
jgi:hypothetical protein